MLGSWNFSLTITFASRPRSRICASRKLSTDQMNDTIRTSRNVAR
jgi:hypothetical protein